MNNVQIDKTKLKNIIQYSYRQFRKREREGISRNQTIDEIVKMIKKELKDNAD